VIWYNGHLLFCGCRNESTCRQNRQVALGCKLLLLDRLHEMLVANPLLPSPSPQSLSVDDTVL